MRTTKSQIDELYALKQAADDAAKTYEEALAKFKAAGAAVHNGTAMALVVEELPRKTIDNKAIFEKYRITDATLAKYTKHTSYLRASFKEINR